MTPVTSNANIYVPPPTLVGGAMPGNNTLRVSAENVPPPVSNVEINNNNRGSGAMLSAAQTAPAPSAATGASFSLSPFIYTTPTSLSAGAQNTFITQLMSQDGSPLAQGMLAEYEQIVANSFVKYKPSFATLPEPEPSSVFARAMQEQQQVKATQQTVQQNVQQTVQKTSTSETQASNVATIALPKAAPAKTQNSERAAPVAKASAQTSISPRSAIGAYLAVTARNNAAAKNQSDALESA